MEEVLECTEVEKYPVYKDSGVDWLGEIPKHWEVKKIKYVISVNPKTFIPEIKNREELIEFVPMDQVDENLGLIKNYLFRPFHEVKNGYTMFKKDDVIFAKITPCMENGNCAIVGKLRKNIAYGSTEFIVFRAKQQVKKEFLYFFLRSKVNRLNFEINMKGSAGQKRIAADFIGNYLLPVPPEVEQSKIIAYIQEKSAKIDTTIAQKQKLIELLKERKQILIQNAVTKGLDPNVKLKDSGIDWIGQIPEHWEVKKLKHVVSTNPKTVISEIIKREELIEFVPMDRVDENLGVIKNYLFRPFYEVKNGYTVFKNDDVIFAKITPCMENGNCAIVKNLNRNVAFGSTEFIVFRCNNKVKKEFLYLFLRSKVNRLIFEKNMKGSAGQKRISAEYISNYEMPTPCKEEQLEIINYIETQSTKIDKAITLQEQKIEKLKEYKASLINAAVTGKIDVRGMAD